MSYPGSKGQAGTFQRIIGQMPPHLIYIEAFFGGGFVYRAKRPARASYLLDKKAECLAGIRDSGQNVQLPFLTYPFCVDSIAWLEVTAKHRTPETVIYCDPPYLLSTRKGRRYYEHEMTLADHQRLLAVLKSLDCHVLLSGYPSELYGRELQDWRCLSYRTRTRGRTVTECLWCNFPEPTELHDWRFAGKNYRERLSLKRLATRYLARLQAMPPRKRGYVLDAVHNVYPGADGHQGK